MAKHYYKVDTKEGLTRSFDNYPDAKRFVEHTHNYSMSPYCLQQLIHHELVEDGQTYQVSENDVDYIPEKPKFTDYYRDSDNHIAGIMIIYWFLVCVWFAYMCIFIYNMLSVWTSTNDFFGCAIWELDRIGWLQFYMFLHTILFGISIQIAPAKNNGKIGNWINKLVIHVPESIIPLFLLIIGIGCICGCAGVIDAAGISLGFIPVAPIVCLGLFIGVACLFAFGQTITILFIYFAEPLLYIAYTVSSFVKSIKLNNYGKI